MRAGFFAAADGQWADWLRPHAASDSEDRMRDEIVLRTS